MLTRVVIYRRHLRHSTLMPSSLRTLRLCVQLSSSQYSNLPPCKPSRLFSSPLYIIISSVPYLTISLSSRPDPVGFSAHYCFRSFTCSTHGTPASVANNNSHSETHHSLLAIPPAGSILCVGI